MLSTGHQVCRKKKKKKEKEFGITLIEEFVGKGAFHSLDNTIRTN